MNGHENAVNEHIEYLKGTDTYRQYKKLTEYTGMEASQAFFSELDKEIEKIEALEGSLYTQEGKNAAIREKTQELADKHYAEGDQHANQYNQTVVDLAKSLEKKLAAESDMSEFEANKRLLRNTEYQGKVKNELMFARSGRQVLEILSDMVNKVEVTENKAFGKYLLNNLYLFSEQMDKIGAEGNERALLAGNLANNKSKLENLVLSKSDRAYKAIQEEIKNKWASNGSSNLLIKMRIERIMNKYK